MLPLLIYRERERGSGARVAIYHRRACDVIQTYETFFSFYLFIAFLEGIYLARNELQLTDTPSSTLKLEKKKIFFRKEFFNKKNKTLNRRRTETLTNCVKSRRPSTIEHDMSTLSREFQVFLCVYCFRWKVHSSSSLFTALFLSRCIDHTIFNILQHYYYSVINCQKVAPM